MPHDKLLLAFFSFLFFSFHDDHFGGSGPLTHLLSPQTLSHIHKQAHKHKDNPITNNMATKDTVRLRGARWCCCCC
uniref:Putative secreted peptide n=1 Tax=Anopheles braziliensis TaxID=58242 RepID=A0A2M3ZWI9_9DIPT